MIHIYRIYYALSNEDYILSEFMLRVLHSSESSPSNLAFKYFSISFHY